MLPGPSTAPPGSLTAAWVGGALDDSLGGAIGGTLVTRRHQRSLAQEFQREIKRLLHQPDLDSIQNCLFRIWGNVAFGLPINAEHLRDTVARISLESGVPMLRALSKAPLSAFSVLSRQYWNGWHLQTWGRPWRDSEPQGARDFLSFALQGGPETWFSNEIHRIMKQFWLMMRLVSPICIIDLEDATRAFHGLLELRDLRSYPSLMYGLTSAAKSTQRYLLRALPEILAQWEPPAVLVDAAFPSLGLPGLRPDPCDGGGEGFAARRHWLLHSENLPDFLRLLWELLACDAPYAHVDDETARTFIEALQALAEVPPAHFMLILCALQEAILHTFYEALRSTPTSSALVPGLQESPEGLLHETRSRGRNPQHGSRLL